MNEAEILKWANTKLKDAQKTSKINSFDDPALKNSIPLLDLIDAIRPERCQILIRAISVNYETLNPGDTSAKELLANAKYTISLGRKIGANIFISPEDIVELNPRMIFMLIAALMAVDLKK